MSILYLNANDQIANAGIAYSAVVSFSRTADTNSYLANDVIGPATGATAARAFNWLDANGNAPPVGSSLIITSSALQINLSSVISGMTNFKLYKYNITPPTAFGDNTAFNFHADDRAAFLRMGLIDLGTPVDLGGTLYVEQNGLNKQIKLTSTVSYGYLITVGAYTPTASDGFVITLHGMRV